MTLREFIKQNRAEIDRAIFNQLYHRNYSPTKINNDEERRLWVLNDEGLYGWARSEGVRI